MNHQFKRQFIIATLFSFSFFILATTAQAWTGPTANPPGNNADAPINVSAIEQIKSGFLRVARLFPYGGVFFPSSVNDATLEAGGKIGFKLPGFSTTNALDIVGSGSSPNRKIRIWDDLYGDANSQICIEGGSCSTFTNIVNNGGGNVPDGNASGQTLRWTGSAWVTSSVITNTGNRLEVQGTTGSNQVAKLIGPASGATDGPILAFSRPNAGASNANYQIELRDNDNLQFATNDDAFGSRVVRMVLTQAGNLGIGRTPSPLYKLDVAGSIVASGDIVMDGELTIAGGSPSYGKVLMAANSNGDAFWTATSSLGITGGGGGTGNGYWALDTASGVPDRIKSIGANGAESGGVSIDSNTGESLWVKGSSYFEGGGLFIMPPASNTLGQNYPIGFGVLSLGSSPVNSFFGEPTVTLPAGEVPKVFINNIITNNTFDQGLRVHNAGAGWTGFFKGSTNGVMAVGTTMALRAEGPSLLNGTVQLPAIASQGPAVATTNRVLVTDTSGNVGWKDQASVGGLPGGNINDTLRREANGTWKATSTIAIDSAGRVGIGFAPFNGADLAVDGTTWINGDVAIQRNSQIIGNLGIGDYDSAYKLNVTGNSRFNGPAYIGNSGATLVTGEVPKVTINNTNTSNAFDQGLNIQNDGQGWALSATGNTYGIRAIGTNQALRANGPTVLNGTVNLPFIASQGPAVATTNRVLVTDTSGNVGWKDQASVGGLPGGTAGQTLRYDGITRTWIADSNISNTASNVTIQTGTVRLAGIPQGTNNTRVITADTNGNLAWQATSTLGISSGLQTGTDGQTLRNLNGVWAPSDLIRVNNTTGNVGIGTTNPLGKLQIRTGSYSRGDNNIAFFNGHLGSTSGVTMSAFHDASTDLPLALQASEFVFLRGQVKLTNVPIEDDPTVKKGDGNGDYVLVLGADGVITAKKLEDLHFVGSGLRLGSVAMFLAGVAVVGLPAIGDWIF